MIKLKGTEQSDHARSAMTKAFGGTVKKELNPDWKVGQSEYEQVSIRAGATGVDKKEDLSEVHNIYKSKDILATGELKSNKHGDESGDDSDDLFGDDDVLNQLHQARLAQLKKQGEIVQKYKNLGHGSYGHVTEQEFLPAVTGSKLVVCHFYHPEYETCKIMDRHLKEIAPKYLPVRFIHIDANKAPFFVEKLKIRMLPTIVLFRDGIAFDRIVGFDELGGVQDFPTSVLVNRLKKAKILRSIRQEDGEEISGDEEDVKNRGAYFRQSNRGAVQETEYSEGED